MWFSHFSAYGHAEVMVSKYIEANVIYLQICMAVMKEKNHVNATLLSVLMMIVITAVVHVGKAEIHLSLTWMVKLMENANIIKI